MQWSFQNYIMLKSSRKKLIAIGCSFTEHYLSSIHTPDFDYNFPRWPQHLADKLDMECVNLGDSGQGNEYILSKLIDNVLTEKNIGLVVLMWSEWSRQDFQDPANGWYSFHPHRDNSETEKYPIDSKSRNSILHYNNTYDVTMKSLRHFLIAQMLLKDIPYLMMQGPIPLVLQHQRYMHHAARRKNRRALFKLELNAMIDSKIFDEIDEKKFIGWPILKQIGGYTVGNILNKIDPEQKELRISKDDSHPNAEGHKIIAQEIYNAYEKVYL
jgi:hypothetical protein